tara:strand:- start:899 stop:1657 length:759 start_codon:yes stop_codon:yes gene_type:complete
MIKKISFIGSGNVATHLALAFQKSNIKIIQIVSRNEKSGKLLAKHTNSLFTSNIQNLLKTDLIITCVNDDNIASIVKQIPNIPIVHTSGNNSITVFTNKLNYGVLYPLQTLNKEISIDFKNIPLCVEGNNANFEKDILKLGQKISNKVYYVNSENRKHLHLSAVIASNFSNFCYLIAKKQLDSKNLKFDLLKPLILETAQKIINTDPTLTQTGPAKRGDKKVIKQHLEILKDDNYKKIYKLLSQNILKEYGK